MMQNMPEAPDYGLPSSWAFVPPQEVGGPQHPPLPVDLIYCPGTLLRGRGPAFYDPADPELRALARRPRLAQASAFAATANIYQPHLRQVSMESHFLPPKELMAAYAVSYGDLRRAFLHYFEHWNQGRPYLLAGHSQGSALLLELLKDLLADDRLRKGLVAAYIIGISVTEADLAAHPGMRMAQRADDCGVIVSYNTLASDGRKAFTLKPGALCVNPLNWTNGPEYAPASLNLGRVDFDVNGKLSRETPACTDAWIDPELGALRIGAYASAEIESGEFFPPGDLHHYNYTFFYRNLEQNAKARAAAFVRGA